MIVLVLNTTAYSAELFHGALQSIPKGDLEAADAYGMQGWTKFRRVIFPNMLRLSWPSYTNEAIFLTHSTTLVFLSAFPARQQVGEAFYYARYFVDQTFNPFVAYPLVAAYFVALTLVIVAGLRAGRAAAEPAFAANPARAVPVPPAIYPLGHGPEGLRQIRVVIPDLNGIARAKRMPASALPKLMAGQAKMPLSALNLDILGNDIADSPLLFDTGDADGFLRPTARGLLPMPWIGPDAAMLPMAMHLEDGTPFAGDARHALGGRDRPAGRARSDRRDRDRAGILPDRRQRHVFQPPANPATGRRSWGAATLSMQVMDAFNPFFDALYAGCEALGITPTPPRQRPGRASSRST